MCTQILFYTILSDQKLEISYLSILIRSNVTVQISLYASTINKSSDLDKGRYYHHHQVCFQNPHYQHCSSHLDPTSTGFQSMKRIFMIAYYYVTYQNSIIIIYYQFDKKKTKKKTILFSYTWSRSKLLFYCILAMVQFWYR